MTPRTLETDLPILEAIADEPSISQRELAKKVGLSLSKAHFVLKRLMEKGLVKVDNVRKSKHKLNYVYLLTPKGIEEKAKLTVAFMNAMASQYQRMTDTVEDALDRAVNACKEDGGGRVQIGILGNGPLAEVVQALIDIRDDVAFCADLKFAQAGLVLDLEAERPDVPGMVWVELGK
jgi:EPS-associated MarR family transcriptional regulator